jgi:hypothetical protein
MILGVWAPPAIADDALPGNAAVAGDVAQNEDAGNGIFSDVPTSSWAYDAVKRLANEGLIKGYPNGKFIGSRPLTRYEMAVLIDRADDAARLRLAGDQAVSTASLQTLQRLMDSFSKDLANVKQDVAKLQSQTAANTAAIAANTTAIASDTAQIQQTASTVKAGALHAAWWIRAPGTLTNEVVANNGPTTLTTPFGAVAPGHQLPNGLGPASIGAAGVLGAVGAGAVQNSYVTGTTSHGIGDQIILPFFTGQLNDHLSYLFRIDGRQYFDQPNGLNNTLPAFCTSTTLPTLGGCGQQDYNGSSYAVRISKAYFQYALPSGLYFQAGRWQTGEGRFNNLAMVTGEYGNGGIIGFQNPRIDLAAGYGFGDTAVGNFASTGQALTAAPGTAQSQQTMFIRGDYNFANRTDIGLTFDQQLGYQNTEWNPSALLCMNAAATAFASSITSCGGTTPVTIATAAGPVTGAYQLTNSPIRVGSIYAVQYFGAKRDIKLSVEGAMRFGNSSLTNAAWLGNKSFTAALDIGGFGDGSHPTRENANWLELLYFNDQFNSLNLADSNINGAPSESALLLSNPNGYQGEQVGFFHYFARQFALGLTYQHYGLPGGTSIPAGSPTCPGCFISANNQNSVWLESQLFF